MENRRANLAVITLELDFSSRRFVRNFLSGNQHRCLLRRCFWSLGWGRGIRFWSGGLGRLVSGKCGNGQGQKQRRCSNHAATLGAWGILVHGQKRAPNPHLDADPSDHSACMARISCLTISASSFGAKALAQLPKLSTQRRTSSSRPTSKQTSTRVPLALSNLVS